MMNREIQLEASPRVLHQSPFDDIVQKLADERNFLGYYKTSAKTGVGVYEAFQAIIKNLYNKYKES